MFLFYFYSAEKIYNKLYVISVIICEMTEVPVPYVAVSNKYSLNFSKFEVYVHDILCAELSRSCS